MNWMQRSEELLLASFPQGGGVSGEDRSYIRFILSCGKDQLPSHRTAQEMGEGTENEQQPGVCAQFSSKLGAMARTVPSDLYFLQRLSTSP